MSAALLGLAAGIAAGAVMARSGLCFNRALRRAAFERRPTLLRAFAIAVATQLVLLPVLVAVGVDPLVHSAQAGGPALLPAAQLATGLPLLSFGSLLATASMGGGALLTWRLLLAARPGLRGRESTLTA